MNLQREIYQQIPTELLESPGKLDTRGAAGPYGMLVAAPGGRVTYRIVSQQEFLQNVPDFPRERVGPDWVLIAVGDDAGTSLFCYPWEMVKDVVG